MHRTLVIILLYFTSLLVKYHLHNFYFKFLFKTVQNKIFAPVGKDQRKLVSQGNLKLNPTKISKAPEDSRYDDPQMIDKALEDFNQSATRQESRS